MKNALILLLLLITHLAVGQTKVQKIDSLLVKLYAAGRINGNFLVAEKGKIVYSKSLGIANEETGELLNPNSVFEVASVTKQFTAMAVMLLQEKGKLSLDDSLSKHLPELAHYKGITLRQLLNHTSGLPDYMELLEKDFDPTKIATNKDVITYFVQKQPKIVFKAGSRHEYCNTGYAFLASIIERVTGKSYDTFLKQAIFRPLGMASSFVYKRRLKPRKIDNYAFGYVYSDSLKKYILPDKQKETKYVVLLDGVVGDGGVNSTVNDLLKWDRALHKGQLLSKKATEAMFNATQLPNGTEVNYGLGWQIETHPEFGKIVYHGGGWPGYATFIARHLRDDKIIIILQNHDNITLPVSQINNFIYGKPEIKKLITSPELLRKFVGSYELQPGFSIQIELQNGQLYAKAAGQPTLELIPETDHLFRLEEIGAQVRFNADAIGTVKSLSFIQAGQSIEWKKVN